MKTTLLSLILLFFALQLQAQQHDTLWVESVLNRAATAMQAGNFQEYKTIFIAAADSARTRFGPESAETALMLDFLGDVQKMTGDYPGAEQSYMTALSILENLVVKPNAQLAKIMSQLGYARFRLGKYDTVEPLLTGARQMFEDLGMHYSFQQSNVCSSLGAVYQARGQYLRAEAMHLEAIDIVQKMPRFDERIYSTLANNLAVFYSQMQRSGDALHYYDVALAIKEKQFGVEHQQYLFTLKNKGRILADAGRYGEAESILMEALATSRKNLAPDDPQLSPYCLGLALLYEKTGNCAAAIRLQQESLGLLEKRYGQGFPDYISGLTNLADTYRNCGQLAEADTLLQQVIRILEAENRTQTSMYTKALSLLGSVCQQTQRYAEARALLEKGALLNERISGKTHPSYYELHAEALVRQDLLENRPDSALYRLDAVRDIVVETYGDRHDWFVRLEAQYGMAWQMKNDPARTIRHFRAAFGAMQQNLAENFRYLSTAEREQFAATFENCRTAFLSAARIFPGNADISAFLYDLTLFQKELLASYDRQLLAGWQHQNDSTYRAYLSVREMIARQWTLPVKDRHDLPELESRRTALEKKLSENSNLSASGAALNPVRWQQVQLALQAADAALEWLILPPGLDGRSKSCYAALLLRPGTAAPELILLPETAGVDALFASKGSRGLQYATRTYSGDAISRALWHPLEIRLAGSKRIFMAPTGALHLLNFDALPDAGGQLLSEKYQLVRVTNTARLLDPGFGKNLAAAGSALLAGGLDYESATTTAGIPAQTPPGASAGLWRGGTSVREWSALPNTLPEVERISALLQQNNLQTTLLTGAAGSETAVKNLCATANPGILHFATHGFFFEKKSPATGTLRLATAENPMFRSGIILAGANPAWRGESGTGVQDDGILTADEISLLPLRNTALVVLSACETGLGDVHDDEGVYGLQRAFRLAGAQNIVMSLWRVPDAQTRLFMEHFYTALLEDGDVRKSFQSARQTMRVEFSNPFYWAGFVLLE